MIPPALLSTYATASFADIRASFATINSNAATFTLGIDYEICNGQSEYELKIRSIEIYFGQFSN